MKKNKVGIIAGSFDIIHPGYVKMFKEAREMACDYLIVALQEDPTVDRPHKIKPIHTWDERKEVLLSVKYIDEVIWYNTESDLLNLLKNTEYHVRILGADYIDKHFTGKELEKDVYFCNRDHSYSLTSLKMSIYQSLKEKKE
jgi:glycerol-3-phosphate cytidylyltransferase